jgi:hypothetical protein
MFPSEVALNSVYSPQFMIAVLTDAFVGTDGGLTIRVTATRLGLEQFELYASA